MHKNLKIAYIDDDADDRFIFETLIDQIGYKAAFTSFSSATDFRDFLEKEYTTDTPLLVFIDINMPIKSGIDVIKDLRKNALYHYIPFIVLSGSNSQNDLGQAIQAGANGYLIKSADLGDLSKNIKGSIKNWENILVQNWI